ncbi:recombinase family protein [Microvirga thermotolerans]|uniref:Recombinase family protein n=2 Tax=Microvirga thermotolerans TaxID=2651334 RepID=A0A5P9JR73_9HYPH|nr:recombinase family protein [Microvirga thermotolerans]QFU15154.1 recombinase family protein [Microvirga thermotolerans]
MEIICTGVFGRMRRSYGYSRCSTSSQDWAIQLDALARAGVDDRDVYREKASGVKRDRTELRRVLDLLRPDDRLYVYALDRLARSQLHLLQIVEEIEKKGAKLISLRENIDTSSALGKFFTGILGSLSAMERELIMERTKAGVALARERGVKFGRTPKLTPSLIRQVLLAHDDPATTVPETCRILGISRSSYYSALRAGRLQAKDLVIEAA